MCYVKYERKKKELGQRKFTPPVQSHSSQWIGLQSNINSSPASFFSPFPQRRPAGKGSVPWGRAMGCGGSRTDVLEPRYLESWTKETESTWLTSTDTDIPLSSIQSIPSESSEAGFTSEKTISPGEKATAEWTDEWTLNWSPLTGTGSNSAAEQINYTCVIV